MRGPVRASLGTAWSAVRPAGIVAVMNTTKSTLAVIIGSVREGRFGPVVASWVAAQAAEHGAFDVDVIDLVDVDLPLALPAVSPKGAGDTYPRPEGMRDVTERLERADAFVVVTPEYNHSYPASLKALIDWHFTQLSLIHI